MNSLIWCVLWDKPYEDTRAVSDSGVSSLLGVIIACSVSLVVRRRGRPAEKKKKKKK